MRLLRSILFGVLLVVSAWPALGQSGDQRSGRQQVRRSQSARRLRFNGRPATRQDLAIIAQLEARTGFRVPDGSYWYDRVSGAAGPWQGPLQWFLPPNLALGGSLPAHASGHTGTGVFINGREIHPVEVTRLQVLLGMPPQRGRWWVDARGNYGPVGGPAIGNIVQMANWRKRLLSPNTDSYGRSVNWGVGVAGDGETTCVNTAEYTRCY